MTGHNMAPAGTGLRKTALQHHGQGGPLTGSTTPGVTLRQDATIRGVRSSQKWPRHGPAGPAILAGKRVTKSQGFSRSSMLRGNQISNARSSSKPGPPEKQQL